MKTKALDYLAILLGSSLYAFSITTINLPNQLADGGVTGIALILKNLWNLPPSLTTLGMNLPLLVIAYLFLGQASILKTIFGIFSLSAWLSIWGSLPLAFSFPSLLIASLLTGVMSGIGCGLVFRAGGSTGGTDVIYQLLEKYRQIKIGTSLLVITSAILVLSLSYLDMKHFLYTLLSCLIFSRTINAVKYLDFSAILSR